MDERCDFGMSCRPFLPRNVDVEEVELPLLLGIDITVGMPLSLHEVE